MKETTDWLLILAWVSFGLLVVILTIVIAIHQRNGKSDPDQVEAARSQISADLGKFEGLLRRIAEDMAWLRKRWDEFRRNR